MWTDKAVGEMGRATGETIRLNARIAGEIQPADIPLNPEIDLAALKSGDSEPLEVVVNVPAGKSKRGWKYMPEAIKAIVGEVMSQGLSGFLGHQKAEDVDTEFPVPVTHWVGAKWDDATNKGYFRGVVDKSAADLKRWIKAKAIKNVSIFGIPKLAKVAGETQVVGYKPLSIDWTPLGRAGMPTAVVATGEMDDEIAGELDGSHEELREAIRTAAKTLFGDGPYENQNGGEDNMTWKELVAQLKKMLASKDVTMGQVVGEMGWKAQDVAGEIDSKWLKEVTGAVETLGKVKETLGITGEMDVLEVAKKAQEAVEAQAKAAHTKLISDAVAEKVTGEMAQSLITKMLDVPEDATKELITGEIDKLLADETVKAALGKLYTDKPPVIGTGTNDSKTTTLRTKRQAI